MNNKAEQIPHENEKIPIGSELGSEEWKQQRIKNLELKLDSLRNRVKVLEQGNRPTAKDIIKKHKKEIEKIKRELKALDPQQIDLFE